MTLQKDPERNEIKSLRKMADLAGRRILEVGCGEGRLTWRYAAAARWTAAIDLDRDALRVATIDRPSDLEGKTFFARASSIHLPFSTETFDLAILAWSL